MRLVFGYRAGWPAMLLLAVSLGWVGGCSDLRQDAAAPTGPASPVHPEGWVFPAGKEAFHGQQIRQMGWDLSSCKSCHGADYAGGIVETSCLTCHSDTPEDCNVCHGGRGNAPPQDLSGNVATRFAGVGAHQSHLRTEAIAEVSCSECHQVPQVYAAAGHIDADGRAEVTWGTVATAGADVPTFDQETLSCASTYCHSGGRFGVGSAVVWNDVGSGQAACGTCHSLPPAEDTGHPSVAEGTLCSTCHSSVVDDDLNVIDKTLHINGRTNF